MILAFMFSACRQKSDICECFETRLAFKELIKSSDDPLELVETENYKSLKARKKECLTKIEPTYFEENNIQRNGRNDKEFLLDELDDCQAVKELLGEE